MSALIRYRVVALVVAVAALVATIVFPRAFAQTLEPHAGPRVAASTTVFSDLVQQVGGDRLAAVQPVVPAGVDVEDYNPSRKTCSGRPGSPAGHEWTGSRSLGAQADRGGPSRPDRRSSSRTVYPPWGWRIGRRRHRRTTATRTSGSIHNYAGCTSRKFTISCRDRPRRCIHLRRQYRRPTWRSSTRSMAGSSSRWPRVPPDNRKLVTFHEAYPYFAARYGFQLIGVIAPSPGQEPSAGELAAARPEGESRPGQGGLQRGPVLAALAQSLAQEAGVQQVVDRPVQRQPWRPARRHLHRDDALQRGAHRPGSGVIAPRPVSLPRVALRRRHGHGAAAGYPRRLVLENVTFAVGPRRAGGHRRPQRSPGSRPCSKSWLACSARGPAPSAVLGQPPGRQPLRVAYLPQAEAVDWSFPVSVRDVVLMGRYRRAGWLRPTSRTDAAAAERALSWSACTSWPVGRLAALGGQQRRAFLARAVGPRAQTCTCWTSRSPGSIPPLRTT